MGFPFGCSAFVCRLRVFGRFRPVSHPYRGQRWSGPVDGHQGMSALVLGALPALDVRRGAKGDDPRGRLAMGMLRELGSIRGGCMGDTRRVVPTEDLSVVHSGTVDVSNTRVIP